MRLDDAVEEQVLDAHVVVEVLEVPQVRRHRRRVQMDRRAAVAGERHVMRLRPARRRGATR